MAGVRHLARRWAGSLSTKEPRADDLAWARSFLADGEWDAWQAMTVQDRRHSLVVARRFVGLRQDATRAEVAGALLHDVGKQQSQLGTMGRVVATVAGRRGDRFRAYHDHEALGAAMLAALGSDPATVELVLGRGPGADLRAVRDIR